jgi:hypothetical protein
MLISMAFLIKIYTLGFLELDKPINLNNNNMKHIKLYEEFVNEEKTEIIHMN